jgi:hypothetical protein
VNNTSEAYYNSPYYLLHKSQVQPIPSPRKGVPSFLDLADFLPQEVMDAISTAGRIEFHAVGDTAAAKSSAQQSAAVSVVLRSSGVDYDLAKHLALLQMLVRGAQIAQGENTVHDWFQTAGEHVPEHFVEFAHGPHVRTEQG